MKRVNLLFTAALVPLDYLALIAAAALAYSLRFSPLFAGLRPITFDLTFSGYMNIALPFALIGIGIFAISGLYSYRPNRIAVEVTRIFTACSTGVAVVLAIAFFSREIFDSRFIVLAIWILSFALVAIERILVRYLQRSLRNFGIGMQHVVIIGKTKQGNSIRYFFERYPRFGYDVSAHFSRFSKTTKEQILRLKKQGQADILLIADDKMTSKEMRALKHFSDIEHLQFFYSAELLPGSETRPVFHTFAAQPVIEVPKTPLAGWGAIYKRIFDIAVSFLLIMLTLPLQILTAIAIMIEDPGAFLIFQKRVGQRGETFTYFKFRSMVKNAHKYRFDPNFIKKHGNMRDGTPLFKLKHDPRVTRVGAFIRKFSIDELPEFYLVLFGKMSLIGPRPHLPEEVDNYKPDQKRSLMLKPGITGLAQVSGRADLEFDEEIKLDLYYIQNWSPWLDIVILLKTPLVVLFRNGAY